MLVTKQLTVAIDFNSMKKKILWKSMATVNRLVTNIIWFFSSPNKHNLALEKLE